MTQPSFLFDSTARADELDRQINDVLLGRSGGPGITPFPLTEEQRLVLRALQYHKGRASALLIRELEAKLGLGDRAIKQAVSGLVRDFGLPIVGNRQTGGYYFALSAEELFADSEPLRKQIVSECRRYRAVTNRQRVTELLGQIRAEMDGEEI